MANQGLDHYQFDISLCYLFLFQQQNDSALKPEEQCCPFSKYIFKAVAY